MVWFFERREETIRLHVAYDNATKEFVATVMWSHGREDQSRLDTLTAFRDWLHVFEDALEEDQFQQQGPPLMLPDGWPDEPIT